MSSLVHRIGNYILLFDSSLKAPWARYSSLASASREFLKPLPSGKAIGAKPFSEGWLPSSFVPAPVKANGGISATGSNGAVVKIVEDVFNPRTGANGDVIFLTAVAESQYRKDYWKLYSISHGFKHSTLHDRLVISTSNKSTAFAMSEIKGFIVTATGQHQTAATMTKFVQRLKYIS